MKRLGWSVLLAAVMLGSAGAQNGGKRVELKEITDGKFRQVTAVGHGDE